MLRVTLPFCRKDAAAMANLLRWARELNPSVNHNCLLSYESGTDPTEIRGLAKQYFKGDILENEYSPPPVPGWPAACNWAWQSAARFIDDKKVNEPWFWWEYDAVPLQPGWLDAIEDGYRKGGKRFAGHIVDRMDHMNGVGIYPPDVRRRCQEAMMCRSAAWDYVLKETITYDCTNLNHLIQHVWNIRESDGAITNGDGQPVSFPDWPSVERWMDFNCVLLHRTKDGTLMQRLRENRAKIKEEERLRQEEDNRKAVSTELNVPDHTKGGVIELPKPETPSGFNTEILIVTYGLPTMRPSNLVVSDFDWLRWCLKSIRRHCTGFSGITLAIPSRDAERLKPISKEHANSECGIPLRIKMFEEPVGKGFLMHEVMMASADKLVPSDTKFVLHVDADVIFKEAVTPDEYVQNGKPVYVWRSYQSLSEFRNGQQVVSDCVQWKAPTEAQLGFEVEQYTMLRHPSGFPIAFYKKYREYIEATHRLPFNEYMLSGRNNHPADRMDFTAMGAWAFKFMHDEFYWIDVSGGNHLAPRDKQKCWWSHGGVTPAIQQEIEGFLA